MSETLYREPAPAKRALPMLERVRVASPCDVAWEDMEGDDKVRFCGTCEKNVYDLSAMTRYEAESFLLEHEENLPCARFYRRADGRILTADCPVGRAWKWRKRRTLATRATLGTLLLGTLIEVLQIAVSPAEPEAKATVNAGALAVSTPPTDESRAVYKKVSPPGDKAGEE